MTRDAWEWVYRRFGADGDPRKFAAEILSSSEYYAAWLLKCALEKDSFWNGIRDLDKDFWKAFWTKLPAAASRPFIAFWWSYSPQMTAIDEDGAVTVEGKYVWDGIGDHRNAYGFSAKGCMLTFPIYRPARSGGIPEVLRGGRRDY